MLVSSDANNKSHDRSNILIPAVRVYNDGCNRVDDPNVETNLGNSATAGSPRRQLEFKPDNLGSLCGNARSNMRAFTSTEW